MVQYQENGMTGSDQMEFYEYYCPKCETHIVGPEPKEKHIKNCDGTFKGTLLPNPQI